MFQQNAKEELAIKNSELSKLTDSYDQLTRKIVHYKEQNTALQETIKEHQKIRTELEEKLKFEAKINQGTSLLMDTYLGRRRIGFFKKVVNKSLE